VGGSAGGAAAGEPLVGRPPATPSLMGSWTIRMKKITGIIEGCKKFIPQPSSIGGVWISTSNHKTRYWTPTNY
jgi:hypothetical protein